MGSSSSVEGGPLVLGDLWALLLVLIIVAGFGLLIAANLYSRRK